MPFSPAPSNVGRTVAKRTEEWPYSNGTESRDLLPLWNGMIFTSGEAYYIDAQSNQ